MTIVSIYCIYVYLLTYFVDSNLIYILFLSVFEGGIPDNVNYDTKLSLLTLRVQNNRLTTQVTKEICDLDVNKGYELVELGVDCEICNGCSLCNSRCY